MVCPVCNNAVFFEWTQSEKYSIVKCNQCGLGITSPFPTKEESEKFDKAFYNVQQRIEVYFSREDYFKRRYKKYLSTIRKFSNGKKLLDVGCNIGFFLKIAQQEGYETLGVEVIDECADYGRKNFALTIHTGLLENQHFQEECFDVITLFDVLEHVPNMHTMLNEVSRILKRRGLLTIQLPNINSAMARLAKRKWNWLCPTDHLYHFTPNSLSQLLLSKGYQIKQIKTWEPSDEFIATVLPALLGRLGQILAFINFKTKIFSLMALPFQRLLWRTGHGGLILVYAMKKDKQ